MKRPFIRTPLLLLLFLSIAVGVGIWGCSRTDDAPLAP